MWSIQNQAKKPEKLALALESSLSLALGGLILLHEWSSYGKMCSEWPSMLIDCYSNAGVPNTYLWQVGDYIVFLTETSPSQWD